MTNDSPARWILVPMWLTFLAERLYLHLVNPNADLFVAGYNVHHLYTGALIQTAAALAVALDVIGPRWRRAARLALGIGTALVLDEVVYLVTTDGSNASYLLPISLWGAVALMTLATAWVAALAAVRYVRRPH